MAITLVQIFALIPGIVFLGLGLRRILSKIIQWWRLLISGRSPSGYMGKRVSLMNILTGFLSVFVGIGWILIFFYVSIGPNL